ASGNALVGNAGLLLVLAAATVGALSTALAIVTGNARGVRQAPVYAWTILAGAVIAVVAMERARITRDFSIAYVATVGSTTTPPLYNVAAMWSSLEGSLLLWVLVLAGFTGAVAWRFRQRAKDPLVGWAFVVMFAVCVFFGLVAFGPANPFESS